MFDVVATERIIESALDTRFYGPDPDPSGMALHEPILGRDRIQAYSFVHSLLTNFGIKLWEALAENVAQSNGWTVETQKILDKQMTQKANALVDTILRELGSKAKNKSRFPDAKSEVEEIRAVAQDGPTITKPDMENVDIYLTSGESVVAVEMKTVKPNKIGFRAIKRQILEVASCILYENEDVEVLPIVGMPYNPWDPQEYRWMNVRTYFEVGETGQVLAGRWLWKFLANGDDIYDELVRCFERVGVRRRREIEAYFAKFT